MTTIVRTKQGTWRAQERREGMYASQTFRLEAHADEWVAETERLINLGDEPSEWRPGKPKTDADLINMHIIDLR